MTVADLYRQHRLMPNLQVHMYRVAGVAKLVMAGLPFQLDHDAVIKACLLHDLGNILKFKLEAFPAFLEPAGLVYWQRVQAETRARYGDDEHLATMQMVSELGVESKVSTLIDRIGFIHAKENAQEDNWEVKVCAYADMRVAPHGVVSLDERLVDIEKRYRTKFPTLNDEKKRAHFRHHITQIEETLFSQNLFKPAEITEEKVTEFFTEFEAVALSKVL